MQQVFTKYFLKYSAALNSRKAKEEKMSYNFFRKQQKIMAPEEILFVSWLGSFCSFQATEASVVDPNTMNLDPG